MTLVIHLLLSVLPNLNLELATTNYLGGSLDCNLIAKDVELLLYKPLYPQNFSKLSLNSVDVYYGVDILEFLQGKLARYKLPGRVVMVDALPRNAMGKVVAADVKKLLLVR